MENLNRIWIDGKPYEADGKKNLLEACLALGINIPHFCYHAALGSVGACRLCAVKKFRNPEDSKGKIIMSCMEPVCEELIISIEDPEAVAFREAIIESLMINHPHDCPVCDEGGECHLQDMTVMTGHNYRRFGFKKRTHKNQYLGSFIHHEMNRCIECYRCVRFYKDYAGGKDLGVFGAHDRIYFGRHEEGTLESEFSGNLVEVCPTGVFTDKTLKEHYTRKWDLTNTPSLCTLCSIGCNTIAGERYGSLRRIMNRYNGAVNGYFICDRGRFGYEFVNSGQRIRKAQTRGSKGEDLKDSAAEEITNALKSSISGNKKMIGIGSPRASLESNFALSLLVGPGNFYHGIAEDELILTREVINILNAGPAHNSSLKEIEKADAVFILGEDLNNTAPMAALAVRQASRTVPIEKGYEQGIPKWQDAAQREKAQGLKSPVFIATSLSTNLDDIAEGTFHGSPADIAGLGFAVASLIDANAPAVPGLRPETLQLAERIAIRLREAKKPLVISGTHSGSIGMLHAAHNISKALVAAGKPASISLVVTEGNSLGTGMMEGKSLDEAIRRIDAEGTDTLIILENDLYRRAGKNQVDSLVEKAGTVIVMDHMENATTRKADILLPVGTFAESEGTLVNNEGRAQRFYSALPEPGAVIESWRQVRDCMKIAGISIASEWQTFGDLVNYMSGELPQFSVLREHKPEGDFKMLSEKIRRQTLRYSGRAAMNAKIAVSEPKPPQDPDSPLVFSMEGENEQPPSSLVPYYWAPGWNSVQALNYYLDEPNGSMKGGDPGIRLLGGNVAAKSDYFTPAVNEIILNEDEWLIVPAYRIFGSEELSAKGKAIGERVDQPFLLMNQRDIDKAGLKETNNTILNVAGVQVSVDIKVENSLPDGIAGLSAGLPGMPYVSFPAAGKIG